MGRHSQVNPPGGSPACTAGWHRLTPQLRPAVVKELAVKELAAADLSKASTNPRWSCAAPVGAEGGWSGHASKGDASEEPPNRPAGCIWICNAIVACRYRHVQICAPVENDNVYVDSSNPMPSNLQSHCPGNVCKTSLLLNFQMCRRLPSSNMQHNS